jgi:N-acetyl-anhydromuramyl-L-alanine amidase AmpD
MARFVQARNYTPGRYKSVRLVVIHDMEAPKAGNTAEAVANYFANQYPSGQTGSSAHWCIDNNSEVQCVRESDTAWHAPGMNADGIGLEHAGYASERRANWTDAYSAATLQISAKRAAKICKTYGIPARHLSDNELAAGHAGFVGHVQGTHVYGGSHVDPGPSFPWDVYMTMVQAELAALNKRPWLRSRLLAAAAAAAVSASVFGGVTSIADHRSPAPKPKPVVVVHKPTPTPSKTVAKSPTPKPTSTSCSPTTKPVQKPAPKPVQKPKPAPKADPKPALKAPLHVGSVGADVKYLQTRLHLTADGQFGAQTRAAVVKFQRSNGLGADGVVGSKTWASL